MSCNSQSIFTFDLKSNLTAFTSMTFWFRPYATSSSPIQTIFAAYPGGSSELELCFEYTLSTQYIQIRNSSQPNNPVITNYTITPSNLYFFM